MNYTLDKLLGMEQTTAIIVIVIIVVLVLTVILLYLASVFVDKKYNKIVERLGKYKKTVKPGWHFMVPLLDSVVESIDMSSRVAYSPKEISILTKDSETYNIDYSIKYHVIDAAKFYYATDKFEDVLFSNSANSILDHYKTRSIKSSEELLNVNNEELLNVIKPIGEELGIEIEEIIITSIAK